MDGEVGWSVLDSDEEECKYHPIDLYKTNHIANAKVMVYDLKVSQKVVQHTRWWDYKDKLTLNVIVENLVSGLRKDSKLIYPRMNKKLNSKKGLTVHKIKKAVDWLTENKYVTNHVGLGGEKLEYRVSSYVYPTDTFRSLWTEEVIVESQLQYVEQLGTVELRDGDKVVMVYRNTEGIRRIQNLVRDLNIMNESHEIRDRNGNLMTNIYCRVFNRTFENGGRFYRADVLGLQHSTEDAHGRWHITIDGSNVAEVDFSNVHFKIAGLLNYLDVDNLPLDVYSGMIPDETNSVDRAIVKLAVNIMFNSKDVNKAAQAVQAEINALPTADKEKYTLGSGASVVKMVFKAYPQFEDVLCKNESYGLILQNHDSNLASDIVEVFIEKGYPILIVHDSFIVKVEHMNLLCDTMGDCFRKRFDSYLPVPVGIAWKEKNEEIIQRKIIV